LGFVVGVNGNNGTVEAVVAETVGTFKSDGTVTMDSAAILEFTDFEPDGAMS
jgi:hypothetical protein